MISNVLRTLYRDHVNLEDLLKLIENDVERIGIEQSKPDFEMLTLALEYLVDYPDHYHHPTEDLMYSTLVCRAPKLEGEIGVITADHKSLSQLTGSFSDAVACAIDGGPTNSIRKLGREFLRHYRHHMHIEETELFPAAKKYLTQGDWSEIEMMAKIPVDPLFTEHVREAYLALKRRIVNQAQQNRKVPAA